MWDSRPIIARIAGGVQFTVQSNFVFPSSNTHSNQSQTMQRTADNSQELTSQQLGILDALVPLVAQRMQGQQAGHGLDHVQRVVMSARAIQSEVGGCPFIVELAAWLHDIGDAKFHEGHERSGEFSREILQQFNLLDETIEHVVSIVDGISFRKSSSSSTLTLEGQIVQDADRLDALGAIGIVRTIEYGATRNQPFFDPASDLLSDPTGVGHFYQKLFKLRKLLNTEPARRISQQREEFMREFLRQFFSECGVAVEVP